MSLIKQLWIAITIVMSLALGGSLVVSILSARHYLEQQLHVKNLDNATSLALSLSQMPKDPVTVELQVAAQFDAGHYRLIRLTAPNGAVIVEREYGEVSSRAPEWFTRLIPIEAPAGVAQVQDGWQQFGTLSLESHTRYAYESLWSGTLLLLAWFVGGGALTGLVGTLLIKHITRPLERVVAQAEAIGGRRFVTTAEPSTTEFRSLVRAMNMLSERVRAMLTEESGRLERLRQQAQHDELTGLVNRAHFLNLTEAALGREDAAAGGVLMVARLGDLISLNQQFGRQDTDRLLCELAQRCSALVNIHPGWEAGRLNATDFAVLAVAAANAEDCAEQFRHSLNLVQAAWQEQASLRLPIGVAPYHAGETRDSLLSRVDGALAAAELAGDLAVHIAPPESGTPRHANLQDWRQNLVDALQTEGVRLAAFPALDARGRLMHVEAPMRLFLDGAWQNAGYFMPWAARLGLLSKLDRAMMEAALQQIAHGAHPVGVNLSAASLRDAAFRSDLFAMLQKSPALSARLWIELPEYDVIRNMNEFRALCLTLKPLGCRMGIEHVGRQFSRIGDLHELGLDYLKVDSALVRGIEANPGNQNFLRGLCTVAHAIGLTVIAEGVNSTAEREMLFTLGLDGVTGPAITLEAGGER